ncbi:hypothetical protein PSHO110982_04950 [Pseudostreptobacillus hongkongensis]
MFIPIFLAFLILCVKHNLNTYGILATGVAIELFSLGNIEKFFFMLDTSTKKKIEEIIGFPKNKIENWIDNLILLHIIKDCIIFILIDI